MIKENMEKIDYSILTKTNYKEVEDYLFLNDGFVISDSSILYSPSIKNKVDQMEENFKFRRYRLRYDNLSLFFSDDDIKNNDINSLLEYKITDYIRSEKMLYQSVPANTYIVCSDGSKFNLNNYQLSISYENIVKNKFYLNELPTLEDNKLVHYLTESNSILFSGNRKYIDIKEAILDGHVTLFKNYSYINGSKNIVLENILIYNNKIIGKLINNNELSLNNKNHPSIKISGYNYDISYGITSMEENIETLIYYEDIDSLIGSSTFNEYQIGDIIYYSDANKLFLCQYNGLLEIDFKNIIFSYESPKDLKNGLLWFNLSLSTVNLFNGDFWVQLSKVSLKMLNKKISIDKMIKSYNKEYSLEIYAFDKKDNFKTVEMYVTKNVVTDIEFDLNEWFVESVYINGEETYDFHEASWGIHLFNPIDRGDYIQIIISRNKNYEWVIGNVENNDTIVIDHPYEVESVKNLIINGKSYKINNINHNRLKIKDIDNNYSEPLILNECDRIYAKVKLSKNSSNVYPSFNVEFRPSCKEIEIPFYSPEHRFDKFMITNNGEPVIVNPQIILQQDRLYAYYDTRFPYKVSFSRYIRKEDNINIQFVPHKICKFNPETFLTGVSTKNDINNNIIINAFNSFEDEKISSVFLYDEIGRISEEISAEDEILFSQFENNGVLNQKCSCIVGEENNGSDDQEDEEDGTKPVLTPKPGDITADEYIPTENQYSKTSMSLPDINLGSNDTSIEDMIQTVTINSNPDITSKAILEKPTPSSSNKPVLCKPSRTKLNPVVKVYLIDNERYSKYNLKVTRQYFKKKDELQNYLVGISEKFANMVENLARIRDSLRAMVNYICNILCIAEILKSIIEIFRSIVKAIEALVNFSWSKLFEKIDNIIRKICKNIENFFKKLARSLLNILNDIASAIEKFIKSIQNALTKAAEWIEDACKKIKEAFDKAAESLDKIKSIFNLFDITTIGLKIGSFFKKILDAIVKSIKKVFEIVFKAVSEFFKLFGKLFDLLSNLKLKISNFASNFKNMTLSISIDAIMDLICNKILGSILNIFDAIIDVLDYLQKRFQDFLNKLFADRYRPRGSIINKMVAAGDFFKDHIDLCDILSEMLNEKDFTLAGFIKRVTNLYKLFNNWEHNRDIMDELIRSGNTDGDAVEGLAGAVTDLENLFVSIDELFGMNKKTIGKLIKKLYKGFIPNFKKTTESVVDVQAMSKQLFDVEKFENFYKKLIIL